MAANTATGLPAVNRIGMGEPLRWLAQGWRDFGRAPGPCLAFGVVVALASFGLSAALVRFNAAFWVLVLTCGFVFIGPMLAMGLYEAGRLLESGKRPTLKDMLFVRGALRQDVLYLGLALLFVYLLWGRIAQMVYGLSTYRLHRTVSDFVRFALETPEGHTMLIPGTIIGGAIAFFTYALVVVSAPMLLNEKENAFAATATSFIAVAQNFWPLALWATLIATLLLATAFTAFIGLAIVFPWLGLASWRAYRALVPQQR